MAYLLLFVMTEVKEPHFRKPIGTPIVEKER